MSSIGDIEKLAGDYEKRIQKLKQLERELEVLNTNGLESEVAEIQKHIKDPKSLEKVEGDIKDLKIKIVERRKTSDVKDSEKEKSSRDEAPTHYPPTFTTRFPYELTPYYDNPALIGKGGFARVFRANRKKDNEEIAIKIPLSMDRAIGKSFVKELENWTKLKHQNIVEIYDYNVLPIPYFEMELCDSCLETMAKPTDIEKATWIIFNTAEGLKHAHNKKIAHRDMKPQNILLKNGVPKISDWGLSKLTAESKTSTMAAFSPVYAAPEHISKKFGAKDEQTDIWQLGVIFYELVTGKLPFEGDDITEISFKIINEDLVLPSEVNIDAAKVDSAIKKCLQKEKSKRYKDIEKLQKDLAEVLNIEYKCLLKESTDVKNLSKSAYFCGELVTVNLKIGEVKDAYKYASSMLTYADDEIKDELENLCKQLEAVIENKLDVNEQLIEKADIIMHKVRLGK